MPKLSADSCRVLELLAGSPAGMTDSLLLAHGVTRTLLAKMILDGLASADAERIMARGKVVELRRIGITEVGRRRSERT